MISTVTSTDIVLIALTVVALLAVAALGVTVLVLRTAIKELRADLARFAETAGPAAAELEKATLNLTSAAATAGEQVDRLENLIDVAGTVTNTVDSATAATVRVLSNPVIKTAAMAKGTRRAARRLKSAEEN